MIPTEENIREVARFRLRAIRARAEELGVTESDDELVRYVVAEALALADRRHHTPKTAQEAVAWAIVGMRAVDISDD